MRKSALAAAVAILLFIASDGQAFRGRPVSGLRFDDHAVPTFSRRAASDGTDFLVLSAQRYPSREGVFAQKIANGEPVGTRRQIGYGTEVAGLSWTGSHYLAGWHREPGLWAAPLSREGTLLGEPVPSIVSGAHTLLAAGTTSALAFAYTEDALTVRPLDLTGHPTANAIAYTAPLLHGEITAAAVGNRFAAVFSGSNGTWLMLFHPDGSLIGSPVVLDGPYGGPASTSTPPWPSRHRTAPTCWSCSRHNRRPAGPTWSPQSSDPTAR